MPIEGAKIDPVSRGRSLGGRKGILRGIGTEHHVDRARVSAMPIAVDECVSSRSSQLGCGPAGLAKGSSAAGVPTRSGALHGRAPGTPCG